MYIFEECNLKRFVQELEKEISKTYNPITKAYYELLKSKSQKRLKVIHEINNN